MGVAVIDIETYIDNDKDSDSMFNMVPFVICLVGNLQQMSVEYVYYDCADGTKKGEYV